MKVKGRKSPRPFAAWQSAACALVAVFMIGCTGMSNTGPNASPTGSRITILYDAFGRAPTMAKDWGYSALVEAGGKRILFDTGDDPDIFAGNVKAAGVDLTRLDFVVMSHRHGDHVGGLSYLLSVNPSVRIYAPKENFGVFGSDLPSKFYRKADTLPADMRYYDGAPPDVMRFGKAWPRANFELVDKTTQVAPGITLIAQVSDAPGTKELKELSLAIDTPEGLLLIVGCSHPGIESIVAEAAKIDAHIHVVAGGFHLVVAPDGMIDKVATALHDVYRIDVIAPGHCTGEPTFAALKAAFGDRYLYAGLGTVLDVGNRPSASAGPAGDSALDAADLATYRAKLAASDDLDEVPRVAMGGR